MSEKRPIDADKSTRTSVDNDTATYEQTFVSDDNKREPARRAPKMPHERDESAQRSESRLGEQPPPSERQVSQAHDDVRRGLVDTDRRGTPNDVPNSGRKRGT